MAAGGEVVFLESLPMPNIMGETAHVQFANPLGDTFEIKYYFDTTNSNANNRFYITGGFINIVGTYFPQTGDRYMLNNTVFSTTQRNAGIPKNATNLWLRWYNNYVETNSQQYQHIANATVQSGMSISEMWFDMGSGNQNPGVLMKKIEVYEDNVLIETFLPAQKGSKVGLYSDVQEKIYVL